MDRTLFLLAIATSGRTLKLDMVAYAATGMMPTSADPSANI
jgi:hypothetical protein